MSSSIDPHPQSKRNQPKPTTMAPLSPVAMSRMAPSAELDEYTASMRDYLANVENRMNGSRKDSTDGNVKRVAGRIESVNGNDREKSPEFRWMDLASVRKEHGNVAQGFPGAADNRISKSIPKSNAHHHHAGKDPRQLHRDHRASSPAGKAISSKRNPVLAGAKSTEKN